MSDEKNERYVPPKTDMDHIHEMLKEVRTHLVAMVAAIDRVLWFDQPSFFDQDKKGD